MTFTASDIALIAIAIALWLILLFGVDVSA